LLEMMRWKEVGTVAAVRWEGYKGSVTRVGVGWGGMVVEGGDRGKGEK